MFLARRVTELLPDEPEALGLLALMLNAEARRRTRRNAEGQYVPLAEQDPELWSSQMIMEAEALLRRASALNSVGRYQLEGALQSAHVSRCRMGEANWAEVVQLYDALFALAASPVVALNRALAIAEAQGASAALNAMPEAVSDARLAGYQPYWAARAELLARTGAREEARDGYEMAIGLERDESVRRFLERRQSAFARRGFTANIGRDTTHNDGVNVPRAQNQFAGAVEGSGPGFVEEHVAGSHAQTFVERRRLRALVEYALLDRWTELAQHSTVGGVGPEHDAWYE